MSDNKKPYWHRIENNSKQAQQADINTQKQHMERYLLPEDRIVPTLKRNRLIIFLSPLCMIAGICACCILIAYNHAFIGIALAILGTILTCAIALAIIFNENHTIKYSLVYQAIKKYFEPEIYLAYRKIPEDIISEADIADEWDTASASDYIYGAWKECTFEFADISLRGRELKSEKPKTIFSGQLFVIETNLALESPICIRERLQPLSTEMYEGLKNSDRFFLTGNEKFDRQFDVRLGNSRCVSGFEAGTNGISPSQQRQKAHEIVDAIAQDIIEADSFAVSRTTMRFSGNRLYLAIENNRDTFELSRSNMFELLRGDFKQINMLRQRFDEELQNMSMYLDLVTTCLNKLPHSEQQSAQNDKQ